MIIKWFLFCVVIQVSLWFFAVGFGDYFFSYRWGFGFFAILNVLLSYFTVFSFLTSIFYKYIFSYDPELKEKIVNHFVFGFLVWKELHPVDDNK